MRAHSLTIPSAKYPKTNRHLFRALSSLQQLSSFRAAGGPAVVVAFALRMSAGLQPWPLPLPVLGAPPSTDSLTVGQDGVLGAARPLSPEHAFKRASPDLPVFFPNG